MAVNREPASAKAFETYRDIVKAYTWRVGRKRRRLVRVAAKLKPRTEKEQIYLWFAVSEIVLHRSRY